MQKKIYRNVAIIWIFLFCITQLSGCSLITRHFSRRDGAPNANIDVTKIPDAVPKVEPRSQYGNSNYTIDGVHYHVLKSAAGYNKRGYASWYGTKFHGQLTSTRERYNVFDMTAASTELPLPTYVQVTNLQNGKKVIVKVNDRGPFRSHRVLDLSYAAAKKLGFAGNGTTAVQVVAINPRTWGRTIQQPTVIANSKNSSSSASTVYLQAGAFTQLANAQQSAEHLVAITKKTNRITHSNNLFRVQIGPLASLSQAQQLRQQLEQNGFEHLVVISE